MEQVTAVGKGNTFFLLLVLAASATATSLNTTQQNTAITATSDRQVRSVGCVHETMTLDSLDLCGVTYNTHHTTTFSLSTEKGHSILSFEGLHFKQCWGDVDGRGRGTG